ncbi:MAG TPA: HyaD/HybD family hydrogenase maturation endopeptidase [Candidatus Paceibacterota bacterium]|nr:HyaD/HybD family hydrogenase maturation endopeptidase [Verrucomicrobiota bacterium]HRY49327.1 HyaD/HybD family hydrogenase maturation endopeptidase [Candidatus Paceibacterota bacterium]HSA03284.1 HyaD/HybD family hydrogenase maturation endopeptidase [Candidatus Paceibacterota bacterium]
MKTLIFGAGNLLLSDEGFGVHFVRHLEAHYLFPPEVEILDAGALGIMAAHELESADRVYVVDVLALQGEPGQPMRFNKEDLMLQRIPTKLSPHQIGIQEMLLLSEIRGRCPREIVLLGIIPASMAPGNQLSSLLASQLVPMAEELVKELRSSGLAILPRR